MPLPKIATPTYELELPSTGKKVKYRPFLVKEEKILILALESNDQKQITNAIKQVLKECIQTRNIKVDTLPTFDIEYLFLNIRGKSVSEAVDLQVTCGDDGKTIVPIKVYIDEVKVYKDPDHTCDIKLDDDVSLRMRYPSLDEFVKNNFSNLSDNDESEVEQSFEVVASCIDQVYTEDDAWASADCTKKELIEWVESLTSAQFKQIENFFETMPRLSHTMQVTNPKTKVENTVVLEGLTSFFA
tara:strand:- start:2937 stop:3665 length:729 start_codon:yes stop_codon:yes gene_type:complete